MYKLTEKENIIISKMLENPNQQFWAENIWEILNWKTYKLGDRDRIFRLPCYRFMNRLEKKGVVYRNRREDSLDYEGYYLDLKYIQYLIDVKETQYNT